MEVWHAVLALVLGLVILIFSSGRTVNHLIKLASTLGVSAFIVGFVIASLGTDMPELVNSIFSAYLGHGDISLGDSFGSVMTQITLILGLIPFFCRFCRLIPRRFAIMGLVEVSVLAVSVLLASNGVVSRFDGLLLVFLWVISIVITRKFGEEKVAVEPSEEIKVKDRPLKLLTFVALGFVGIGIGSYLVIESVITISKAVGVSEYIISFFLVALGTSLPELVVELAAIRKRHYELALGDIIGSCVVDATLAVGLGPLFFPVSVSGRNIVITGIYAVLASIVVVSTLSFRGRNDKKSGGLFIILYGLSYLTLFLF